MTPDISILLAIVIPLLSAAVCVFFGGRLRERTAWVALSAPVLAVALLLHTAATRESAPLVAAWSWIPSLGVDFSLLIDGLSLFFGLVVTGMGALVVFYSRFYLDKHYEHHGRFYCYLLLFMSAMLGTVFANNLLLLFVFWEITGIASFLLIGFFHHDTDTRSGARMALLVTASTGLFMLCGIIMVRQATGTFDLYSLLAHRVGTDEKMWFNAAFLLVAVGAFGKSAQFPFHFWLPNAMSAPTPVSAYLHSATMVKLGVFLCARTYPLFVQTEWWTPVLVAVGLFTMTFAAWFALVSHDLKAILAFSTVSQLGMLIGYYGLGTDRGVEYDYLHILNHVFYKGCLFMVAGIVDHAVGTRDVRKLGGLRHRLPLLWIIAALALAGMAGIPGTMGFLSKEMALKEGGALAFDHGVLMRYALGCFLLTTVLKIAFSARIFVSVFCGREPEELQKHFHRPPPAIYLPPLILVSAVVLFGLWPALLESLIKPLEVARLHDPSEGHLKIWHGVNRELLISLGAFVAGGVLAAVLFRRGWERMGIPGCLRFDTAFVRGVEALPKIAKRLTRAVRSDAPMDYLPILLGSLVLLVGGSIACLWSRGAFTPWLMAFPGFEWNGLRVLLGLLVALGVVGALVLKDWTAQIISLGVSGFLTTFYFVLHRAPDLALTQILVETVVLIVALTLLGRFPAAVRESYRRSRGWNRRKTVALAISAGVGLTMFALVVLATLRPHPEKIGPMYLALSKPFAAGTNVVNTILVDFRGLDTLGEIAVLCIAMLGCLGLLMRRKRTPQEWSEGPHGPPGMGIHHPDPARSEERSQS